MFLKSILDKFDKKNSCGYVKSYKIFKNQNISSYDITMFDMILFVILIYI